MYTKRIKALQGALEEISADALLIEDPVNLYYLTGLQMSAGSLLVSKEGGHLIVDGRYFELCKKSSPVPVLLKDEKRSVFLELLESIQSLAFISDATSHQRYLDLKKQVEKRVTLVPAANVVRKLRMIKDEEEIRLLRSAGELGSLGFDFVCTLLKEGISEEEIAGELEIFWKKRGSKSIGFDPIIAFGANSAMPHYRAGSAKLKPGDTVLIDIGVNLRHYHSDMTRVVFYKMGNPKVLEIYEIVKEAQKAALALCRPGMLIRDVDAAARNLIAGRGYGEFFTHGLGHGVGLEIHEWPVVKDALPFGEMVLKEGMVITIEPGIYLPNVGGVRLEDTVVITNEGHENLTNRKVEPILII